MCDNMYVAWTRDSKGRRVVTELRLHTSPDLMRLNITQGASLKRKIVAKEVGDSGLESELRLTSRERTRHLNWSDRHL